MRHHGTRLAPVIGGLLWLMVSALQVSATELTCEEPPQPPDCFCQNTNKTDFKIPTGYIRLDPDVPLDCDASRCIATLKYNNDPYNKLNGDPIERFGGLQVRLRRPGDDSFIPTDVAGWSEWSPDNDQTLVVRVFDDLEVGPRDKTFILYAVSNPLQEEPFNVYPLAELRVRFPHNSTGSIEADPNPCHIYESTGYCTTEVSFETAGVPPVEPPGQRHAFVTVHGTTDWFQCFDPNSEHDWNGLHITTAGKTFRLWVADLPCSTTVKEILSKGEELDSVWVDGEPADAPLCPIDGRAMVRRIHDQEEVLGLITNGIKNCAQDPGWCETVADELRWLGVKYIRQTVKWSEVDQYGWSRYDEQFRIFYIDEDDPIEPIEPWITLSHTPCRYAAAGCPAPPADPTNCTMCPLNAEGLAEWPNFVRDAASRFAQFGARNWEIWQEPQAEGYWAGTVAEWIALQNAAKVKIEEVIPDARVWGANLVYAFDQTDLDPVSYEDLGDWIEPHFDGRVHFDGFNMHVFFRDYPADYQPPFVDTLPLAYGWVHQMRRRLDESEMEHVPLAITAVTWHAWEKLDPWSFNRLVPEEEDRQQNFIDAYACLANAARAARGFEDDPTYEDLDHIFWFNAVHTEIPCPNNNLCSEDPDGEHDYFRLGVLCREDPTDLNGAVLRQAVEEIRDWLEAPWK